MTDNYLIFGIEVECEYNPKEIHINRGHYSQPIRKTKNWYAENDGSLNSTKEDWKTAELTTRPFIIEETETILKELKEQVFENKEYQKVININETCGTHIHLSLIKRTEQDITQIKHGKKVFTFKGKPRAIPAGIRVLKTIREKVYKILPKEAQKRYYRNYAKKTSYINYTNGDRRQEWNYISDSHIEYRSYNLTGIKSWETLIEKITKTLKIINDEIINKKTDEYVTFNKIKKEKRNIEQKMIIKKEENINNKFIIKNQRIIDKIKIKLKKNKYNKNITYKDLQETILENTGNGDE